MANLPLTCVKIDEPAGINPNPNTIIIIVNTDNNSQSWLAVNISNASSIGADQEIFKWQEPSDSGQWKSAIKTVDNKIQISSSSTSPIAGVLPIRCSTYVSPASLNMNRDTIYICICTDDGAKTWLSLNTNQLTNDQPIFEWPVLCGSGGRNCKKVICIGGHIQVVLRPC